MTPTAFPEANICLTAPKGIVTDDNVKSIADLPAWCDDWQITSCWRPSWRERLSILLFGRVWLTILGRTQPPVSLVGDRSYFLKPPKGT